MREEIHISVDVEAEGPSPFNFSMGSIGACVVGATHMQFYTELKPQYEKLFSRADTKIYRRTLKIHHLDREDLRGTGQKPHEAMRDFQQWIKAVSKRAKPVFWAKPLGFDWKYVDFYFHKYLRINPFGITGWDYNSYYAGIMRAVSVGEIRALGILPELLADPERYPHSHHALDDAIQQAVMIENTLQYVRVIRGEVS